MYFVGAVWHFCLHLAPTQLVPHIGTINMSKRRKYELEFIIHSSTSILYNFISTPSGLSEWFADNINIKDDVFTFIWDDDEEEAELISSKRGEFVRFKWINEEIEDEFFEFRIKVDAMTKEVALIVTDFAEPAELVSAKQLWESQIHELMHVIGS